MKPLIVSLLLVSIAVHAQTTVRPGDRILRQDLLQPSHDFYQVIVTDTTGAVRYEFVNDDVIRVDSVQRRIIFVRNRQEPVGNFSTDTSITDLSFRPIRMHEIHFQQNISFEMMFGDTLATVASHKGGVTSFKTYPMKTGYFEDNMIEYIIGYLELKKGVQYVLDDFNKDAIAPSNPYMIEYAFDDIWQLHAGYRVNCKVFHYMHGLYPGYVWVDKRTGQMVREVGTYRGGTFVLTKL
jgi:hypothetical protein